MMAEPGRRAVVIGGGIAGLCAAFDLHRAGWQVDVHEAGNRWGGKIHSSPVGDRLVDAGADTFLARAEPGLQLCRDLGLDGELTSPVTPVPAYIARGGSLYALPPGSMLGVPTDLDPLGRSRLV
jgi:oxygen-dependent protoporphyrinogen oxidase